MAFDTPLVSVPSAVKDTNDVEEVEVGDPGEKEDHARVRLALVQLLVNVGCEWASRKLLPWKHLPMKLAKSAVVCKNFPDHVPYPGAQSRSKVSSKGISELTLAECLALLTAIYDPSDGKLCFVKMPHMADALKFSRDPVIIGAAPAYNSSNKRGRRIFANGECTRDGLVRQRNVVATRPKKRAAPPSEAISIDDSEEEVKRPKGKVKTPRAHSVAISLSDTEGEVEFITATKVEKPTRTRRQSQRVKTSSVAKKASNGSEIEVHDITSSPSGSEYAPEGQGKSNQVAPNKPVPTSGAVPKAEIVSSESEVMTISRKRKAKLEVSDRALKKRTVVELRSHAPSNKSKGKARAVQNIARVDSSEALSGEETSMVVASRGGSASPADGASIIEPLETTTCNMPQVSATRETFINSICHIAAPLQAVPAPVPVLSPGPAPASLVAVIPKSTSVSNPIPPPSPTPVSHPSPVSVQLTPAIQVVVPAITCPARLNSHTRPKPTIITKKKGQVVVDETSSVEFPCVAEEGRMNLKTPCGMPSVPDANPSPPTLPTPKSPQAKFHDQDRIACRLDVPSHPILQQLASPQSTHDGNVNYAVFPPPNLPVCDTSVGKPGGDGPAASLPAETQAMHVMPQDTGPSRYDSHSQWTGGWYGPGPRPDPLYQAYHGAAFFNPYTQWGTYDMNSNRLPPIPPPHQGDPKILSGPGYNGAPPYDPAGYFYRAHPMQAPPQLPLPHNIQQGNLLTSVNVPSPPEDAQMTQVGLPAGK
ncbi:hypothetical protein JVU11DRAFT_3004 [Chiua virens]|nr:hypothetical protein JVU11DRAFT_3004 [Chiua virens]